MKKIILLAITLLMLTGCNIEAKEQERKTKYIQNYSCYSIITDKETCVQYVEFGGYRNGGGMSVMYNADGTIKLNEECLNDK